MRSGAWRLSAALAGVSSAARGIQTRAAVQTRCSFQPYTQPCQPDLVQWASVSIEVCGTTPASRSFLCQTPPHGAQHGAVNGGSAGAIGPGLESGHQVAPENTQSGREGWPGPLPGAAPRSGGSARDPGGR